MQFSVLTLSLINIVSLCISDNLNYMHLNYFFRLPIDLPSGASMVAEAVVSGKKKEAVIQCALEACRLLDKQGVLRASKHGTLQLQTIIQEVYS